MVKLPKNQPYTTNTYGGYNLSPGGAGAASNGYYYNSFDPNQTEPLKSVGEMNPNQRAAIFGTAPAQIKAPPSIYDQLKENVPNYAGMQAGAQGNINSELSGNLSTGTQNFLRDKAAAMGISLGQPGGTAGNTITNQKLLQSLGLTSEGLAHEGVADYNQMSNTDASQQQNPELLSSIAEQNAVNAAAPNPAAAQSYAQNLYDKYIDKFNPKPAKVLAPDGSPLASHPIGTRWLGTQIQDPNNNKNY